MTPSTSPVTIYDSPLLLPATPTTRRRKTATSPMLGDKVLALRLLVGAKRKAAERRFLFEAKGFVRSVTAWYRGPDLDDDDVEQTATVALWSAVEDWDEQRAPFDTHARWRMRGALAKLLRGSRVVRGNAQGAFVELDEETATLGDDPESELLKQEAAQEVVQALALLPERQRHVIAAVILSGQVLAAYAAELGLTVKVARKLLADAKDAMAALVLQIRRGAL